jgi:predicted dithiol-disulfide oxidoreductase (DUF899 family)
MPDKHSVVSHEEWIAARKQLLAKEKEFTRMRDRLSQERRDLPWERVEKEYVFEGPEGKERLAELFDGRSQLVVYHFMFGPGAKEGCRSCSFWADTIERNVVHLAQRDVTLIACSRAPYREFETFKKRLGWTFKWVSSAGSDFNFDYHVSFTPEDLAGEVTYNYRREKLGGPEHPGISVFHKDADGAIFHTYSTYGRGLDMMNGAYQYLDLVPKGRDEAAQNPFPMAWVRHRDRYGS